MTNQRIVERRRGLKPLRQTLIAFGAGTIAAILAAQPASAVEYCNPGYPGLDSDMVTPALDPTTIINISPSPREITFLGFPIRNGDKHCDAGDGTQPPDNQIHFNGATSYQWGDNNYHMPTVGNNAPPVVDDNFRTCNFNGAPSTAGHANGITWKCSSINNGGNRGWGIFTHAKKNAPYPDPYDDVSWFPVTSAECLVGITWNAANLCVPLVEFPCYGVDPDPNDISGLPFPVNHGNWHVHIHNYSTGSWESDCIKPNDTVYHSTWIGRFRLLVKQ